MIPAIVFGALFIVGLGLNWHGLPSDPNDLLSDEDKARLQADLNRLADLRRRVEVEGRNERMP